MNGATLTLYALMLAGYKSEAEAWREWLLRAVAGAPSALRYRTEPESSVDGLPPGDGVFLPVFVTLHRR